MAGLHSDTDVTMHGEIAGIAVVWCFARLDRTGTGGIGGANGWPGATPEATPGGTPTANPALAGTNPEDLYDVPPRDAIPVGILPPGPNPTGVNRWQDISDDDLTGTLGGAVIASDDPFGSLVGPAISYIAFPDEAGAAARIAEIAENRGEVGIQVKPVSSLGYPAVIVNFPDQVLGTADIGCVIVANSVAPSGDLDAVSAAVVDLLTAGGEHLMDVAAGER